jgi:hypothetical protein
MKLSTARKMIAKHKEQQAAEPVVQPVVEASAAPIRHARPAGSLNHHRGIIHMMGIDQGSNEYEEMSKDLDDLSRTNPALYHRIVSMD